MLQFPIVFNDKFCKTTETLHKENVNNMQMIILSYIHNVQYVAAVNHWLDQVKFSYRFT